MLAVLEELLVLQDRDQKIRNLEKQIERIPKEEAGSRSRLAADETALKAAKDAVQSNEVAIKKLELEIETCKQTVARLRVQQFETRKNEEFQALNHEIERYGRQITGIEDQEIELMEKAETLKAAQAAASKKHSESLTLVNEELEKLKERLSQCESQLGEIQAERSVLASRVDSEVLRVYDYLFKNKEGKAIVQVSNSGGACGGCHMKITTATLHKARAEKEITHCEQCNRLLYVIDD